MALDGGVGQFGALSAAAPLIAPGQLCHRMTQFNEIPNKYTKFLLLTYFFLSTEMTEKALKIFDRVLLETWGRNILRGIDAEIKVRMPSSITKIQV